jgi:pimeloyl-ACP methyl ester carboxylesterase
MTERVRVGEIEIAHETFGSPGDPSLVLIMGLGMQMLGWREEQCLMLAERARRSYDRDSDPRGVLRQLAAVDVVHTRGGS